MSAAPLYSLLTRASRLRRLIERELAGPRADALHLLRLKALQLRLQSRLALACATSPQLRPMPAGERLPQL